MSDFILLMKATVAELSDLKMMCFLATSSGHVSMAATIAKSSSRAILGLKPSLNKLVSL